MFSILIMEVAITEVVIMDMLPHIMEEGIMDMLPHIMEEGIMDMSTLIMEVVITEVAIMRLIAISITAAKSLCFSSFSSL